MTLIELVVAISIMSIITAIVIPLWSSYAQKQDIKTQAERLADTLRKARSMAMNSEKGELISDENVNVLGYYVYSPAIPQFGNPLPGGALTAYSLMRLSQHKTTLVYTTSIIETVPIVNSTKLYRGQSNAIESVYFTLPFGKTQLYTGEPSAGSLISAVSGCSNNSAACAIFYAVKSGKTDYYYRIEATQEGVVLTQKEP